VAGSLGAQAPPGYSPGPPPTIGDIQTMCVEQYPAPQTRTVVGIGELVNCWIDTSTWSDPDIYTDPYGNQSYVYDTPGSITWSVSGPATISPTVTYDSTPVTLTINLADADGVVIVNATVTDSGIFAADPAVQKQKAMNVKVPTGAVPITVKDNPPAAWQAGMNKVGAATEFGIQVQPNNVNFSKVPMRASYGGIPNYVWPDGTKELIGPSTWGPWNVTSAGNIWNLQTNVIKQDLKVVGVLAGTNFNFTNGGNLQYQDAGNVWKGVGDYSYFTNFQGAMNPMPPPALNQTTVGVLMSDNGNRAEKWGGPQGPWQ
jgi:hypothetical protein